MNKKIFSILTFAIAIGLLIPNTVYFNIYETEKNIKYNLHDNEMIKPCALAPKEQRLKSIQQNPFITDYFAPYFFQNYMIISDTIQKERAVTSLLICFYHFMIHFGAMIFYQKNMIAISLQ